MLDLLLRRSWLQQLFVFVCLFVFGCLVFVSLLIQVDAWEVCAYCPLRFRLRSLLDLRLWLNMLSVFLKVSVRRKVKRLRC